MQPLDGVLRAVPRPTPNLEGGRTKPTGTTPQPRIPCGYTDEWPLRHGCALLRRSVFTNIMDRKLFGWCPKGAAATSSFTLPAWEVWTGPGLREASDHESSQVCMWWDGPEAQGTCPFSLPHLLLHTQGHGLPTTSGKHRFSSDSEYYFDFSLGPVSERKYLQKLTHLKHEWV